MVKRVDMVDEVDLVDYVDNMDLVDNIDMGTCFINKVDMMDPLGPSLL